MNSNSANNFITYLFIRNLKDSSVLNTGYPKFPYSELPIDVTIHQKNVKLCGLSSNGMKKIFNEKIVSNIATRGH